MLQLSKRANNENMKILIVDDSKATQVIVRRVIEKLPYNNIETANANNGIEGLEVIRTWEPDLIISDWHMPEMSGIEMLQNLKREMLGIPIGFMSTETCDTKKQEGFDNGAVFFVQKPFTAEELQSAVTPIIENHANINNIEQSETHEISTYSTEKITLLINLIKRFSDNKVSIDTLENTFFKREQFPCILSILETQSEKKVCALILFDHNASCIIENTLNSTIVKIKNIENKKIDKKTLIQCKLLTKNINQSILSDEQNENLELRSITIIDDNIEVIENLMKKKWKKRIDLKIRGDYSDNTKGVITLISA